MYSKFDLKSTPNQTIIYSIPGENKNISLGVLLSFNTQAKYWTMSLSDPVTGNSIVTGIPLLCGHDLLEQYQYLNIGSVVLVNQTGDQITQPDGKNLQNFFLIWKL